MPPFWALRREEDPLKCNVSIVYLPLKGIWSLAVGQDTLKWDEATLVSYADLCVPVGVNDKDVAAGEELVLHVEPRPKKRAAPKERTWKAELMRGLKQKRVS